MTVAEYVKKFSELSSYAPDLIAQESSKAMKFETAQRSLLCNGDKSMKVAQANALIEQNIFFHKRC